MKNGPRVPGNIHANFCPLFVFELGAGKGQTDGRTRHVMRPIMQRSTDTKCNLRSKSKALISLNDIQCIVVVRQQIVKSVETCTRWCVRRKGRRNIFYRHTTVHTLQHLSVRSWTTVCSGISKCKPTVPTVERTHSHCRLCERHLKVESACMTYAAEIWNNAK